MARDLEPAIVSGSRIYSVRPAECSAGAHDTGYVWASRGVAGSVVHSLVAGMEEEDKDSKAEVALDEASLTSHSSSSASQIPARPTVIVTQASPVCHQTKKPSAHTLSAGLQPCDGQGCDWRTTFQADRTLRDGRAVWQTRHTSLRHSGAHRVQPTSRARRGDTAVL